MSEPTREQIKEAFKETIERWEKIVENPSYFGVSNCHLCYLTTPDHNCNDYCPIQRYGDHVACGDTPFDAFYADKTSPNALAELNFLRKVYIWWMEKEANKIFEKYGTGVVRARKEEKKEEWVDVTEEVKFLPDSRQGNGYYWLAMYFVGASTHFGYIDIDRGFGLCEGEEDNYRIETGKAETCSTYFRILKKA